MVADALLAYPSETGALAPAMSSLLGEREADLAAHIVLAHAPELVPALISAYDGATLRAKAEVLTLLRALLEGSQIEIPPPRNGTPMVDQNATADLNLFSTQNPGAVAETLRALHDDERRDDLRLQPLLNLFPSLPAHLLADALAHPAFSGRGGATASEQAAPLVDAILARTLPPDLHELRAAAASLDTTDADAPGPSAPTPKARRGGWDDVDLSKLRLKGESEGPADIPDSLRASILRLVEAQEEEEQAAARAIAEAHGYGFDDEEEDVAPARAQVGDGEESGQSESEDEDGESPTPARKDNRAQTLLELAYLQTPALFNRDSATRRSPARADLRERTGMDDGQIEGWKVMLERNPHKDAILERHQFSRPANNAPKPKKEGGGESSRGGGGGGGGGGRRGAGSGSAGRGGGRGRGANKGSRGHSNAARTRGHDKKMSRMGVGE
ncbi:hypothetical protein CcaverHIS002_0607080 [Cutaneotrichosporon cavernicola]|nr:hypothetical protein CcaverHIS002_0607080 [Cutaneotrichosporon cavernicola]